jgi:predicted ATPase
MLAERTTGSYSPESTKEEGTPMLLRLHVRGFKNLRDVEIRFGPFTCFVGPNGVGKSNIFDAIQFLRALTEMDIQSAAKSVRSPQKGGFGPQDLLWRGDRNDRMSFSADILVPKEVVDDFGRPVKAATTLLRYELEFRYENGDNPRLVLTKELLQPLPKGEAKRIFGFPHTPLFRSSVLSEVRRRGNFISTQTESGAAKLVIHQDGGGRGLLVPAAAPAGKSPRTVIAVLGGPNAAEYPTVLAAKQEMASWKPFHLEPSSMRTPDSFSGPAQVDEHGGGVAATLWRLSAADRVPGQTMAYAANRLAELVPEVTSIRVDRDEARQQMIVLAQLKGCAGELGPRALSDGTLRFLALVAMQMDNSAHGLLCMEEPENGIHPSRVPELCSLLKEFAVKPDEEIGDDNPLRQVVINTHSPDVVRQLKPSDVLFVETIHGPGGPAASVASYENGWRPATSIYTRRQLADFIGGSPPSEEMKQLDLPFDIGTAR